RSARARIKWCCRQRVSVELHGQLSYFWMGGRPVFALGDYRTRCHSVERGDSRVRISYYFCVLICHASPRGRGGRRIRTGRTDDYCRLFSAFDPRTSHVLFLCRASGRERDWLRDWRILSRTLWCSNVVLRICSVWISTSV